MNSEDSQLSTTGDSSLKTNELKSRPTNSQSAETATAKSFAKQSRPADPMEYEHRIIRNNMRKRVIVSRDPVENEQIKVIRALNRVVRLTYGNTYTKKILRMGNVDERAKIWALFYVFDKFQMTKSQARLAKALQAVAVGQSMAKASRLLLRQRKSGKRAKQNENAIGV